MKLFTSIFVTFVLIQKSLENANHDNNKLKTKNSPVFKPYELQPPQNCDLICPGQPPLILPPNFLQNCQAVNSSSTSTTPKPNNSVSTTQKPTSGTQKATTTGSSNSTLSTTETIESVEEEEGSTEKPSKRKANKQNKARQYQKKLKNQVETIETEGKQHRVKQKKENHAKLTKLKKSNFRSQTVVLKKKDKMKILKNKHHLKERYRLDGCYVICPENQENAGPNVGPIGAPVTEGASPNDYDADNYVEGEDSPIEIIYVPPNIVQQVPAHISPPNNVPQTIPSVPQNEPQNVPQNVPQNLGNVRPQMIPQILPSLLPQHSPFDFGHMNPFGQFFDSVPWDFGPFFRAHPQKQRKQKE